MTADKSLTDKCRIGIFAGAFDPVHAGHITFALRAIKAAKLDRVYLLPERRPRHKPGVEHFGHRTAMVTRAIRPHPQLALLELPDIRFDVRRTLPKLQREFTGCQLVLLLGSDIVSALGSWPGAASLLASCELVIGLRAGQLPTATLRALRSLPARPIYTIVESSDTHISSGAIRLALQQGQRATGLLSSVARYAKRQWLYVSVPGK